MAYGLSGTASIGRGGKQDRGLGFLGVLGFWGLGF